MKLFILFFVASNIFLSFSRNYTAIFTTLDRSGCQSANTISTYFASNCSYFSGGLSTQTCNSEHVIKTSTQTFTPAGLGLSKTLSFDEADIGELTHLYLSGGTDGWCFDQFSILIDESTNEWRTCSFTFMSFMTIDTDCDGNGGLDLITIDVSNSSSLCHSSTSNISTNNSQSMFV